MGVWLAGGLVVAGLAAWCTLRVKPVRCWTGRHRPAVRFVKDGVEWYCPICLREIGVTHVTSCPPVTNVTSTTSVPK